MKKLNKNSCKVYKKLYYKISFYNFYNKNLNSLLYTLHFQFSD